MPLFYQKLKIKYNCQIKSGGLEPEWQAGLRYESAKEEGHYRKSPIKKYNGLERYPLWAATSLLGRTQIVFPGLTPVVLYS